MTERMFDTTPPQIPHVVGDPDLGEPLELDDPVELANDLESLQAELDEQNAADKDTTTIAVPNRPGWAIECRTNFTAPEIEALKRPARDQRFKRTNGGINPGKHAALIVGTMTVRILRNGVPLVLDDAEQTFASKPLQELLGCVPGEGVAAAVHRMFGGKEGRVIATSDKLIEEAGWGTEADLADPTA
jgi:hypothetical protein